jgi:hypothetical protein
MTFSSRSPTIAILCLCCIPLKVVAVKLVEARQHSYPIHPWTMPITISDHARPVGEAEDAQKVHQTEAARAGKAAGGVAAIPRSPPAHAAAAAADPGGQQQPTFTFTSSSGTPPTMADLRMQGGEEEAGEGRGGKATNGKGGRTASTAQWNSMVKLVAQMEARIRDLEAATLDTMFCKANHPVAISSLRAGQQYAEDVRRRKAEGEDGSGAGPPHLRISTAAWAALANTQLPNGADMGLKMRAAATMMMAFAYDCQTAEQVACSLKHFRLRELYVRDGEEPRVVMAFKFEGEMGLPDAGDVDAIIAEMRSTDKARKLSVINAHMDWVDGFPESVHAKKRIFVQRLFLSMMAALGGSKTMGRAPQAYAVKQLGKGGKGKGKRGGKKHREREWDEEDTE